MTYIHRDRSLTLAITGEVDHHHARELMTQIDRQISRSAPKRVTMDLSGVTFMDSSGIALVLRVYKRAGECGGDVAVTHLPAQAKKVLECAGLQRLVEFV